MSAASNESKPPPAEFVNFIVFAEPVVKLN
jgi:hypothetical protein